MKTPNSRMRYLIRREIRNGNSIARRHRIENMRNHRGNKDPYIIIFFIIFTFSNHIYSVYSVDSLALLQRSLLQYAKTHIDQGFLDVNFLFQLRSNLCQQR
jgi:hypothetical protein